MKGWEDEGDKPLPSDELAEKAVLGSMMLNNKNIEPTLKILVPDDFYGLFHRQLFEAAIELYYEGQIVNSISLTSKLRDAGVNIDNMGGTLRITEMQTGVPFGSENSLEFARKVKRHSLSRKTIILAEHVKKELWHGAEDPAVVLEEFETQILALNTEAHSEQHAEEKGFQPLVEIAPVLREKLQDYNKGIFHGVRTGWKELDDKLEGGGLQPGGLYVLGAPEKIGKTALIAGWGYQMAEIDKSSVVPIVTLEMSRVQLAQRLFSLHTGIPSHMFRPGFYDGPEKYYTKAMDSIDGFGKIDIWVADNLFGFQSIARYLRRVVEHFRKIGKPIKIVFIDYMQLIGWDGDTKAFNREREVANVSRGLKQLTAELGIAIVIISNLNRLGLTEGQEPDVHNLRDSGSIGFDAEAIFFLHNPLRVPGKPYIRTPITDITFIIARNRGGPEDRIPLKFIGQFMQFMTESQYRKHFGDTSTDKEVPKSTGQLHLENEVRKDIWDEDDE